MSHKTVVKPLSLALGAAFITSLAGTTIVNAADNPFGMTELSGSYQVADSKDGKCGGAMGADGMKDKDGKHSGKMKAGEGKCGEGKCGAKREAHEGKCGGAMGADGMKDKDGKMKGGEGKCGGKN